MSGEIVSDWTYSHTQLKLWRQCKRRYYYKYVCGFKEPSTPAMCFGTLVHNAIEDWIGGATVPWDFIWETHWANFLADCGETDTFRHPAYNLATAKRCLDLYKRSPVQGRVHNIEQSQVYTFPGGYRYKSKADFIVERPFDGAPVDYPRLQRSTVDLKTSTQAGYYDQDGNWIPGIEPLKPFDDQLLGQAICNEADGFIRVTFQINKKTGEVTSPHIEEQVVDPVLKNEWIRETYATIGDIENHKDAASNDDYDCWPKDSSACMAYGRPCTHMARCALGLTPTR